MLQKAPEKLVQALKHFTILSSNDTDRGFEKLHVRRTAELEEIRVAREAKKQQAAGFVVI